MSKSSNKIIKLILWISKIHTRHHGRKPTPLIYCMQSLQVQFCSTQFLISSLKLFREMDSFIFTERFANFWGLNGRCFQNHDILCSQKVSQNLHFFWNSTPVLSCKNISYSFTRLAMVYLKHLYSTTLDVSMMNRDWPIFF